MDRNRFGWTLIVVGVLSLAGCGGDVANEVRTNVQVRDRVMAVFASDGALAEAMTKRLLAEDSLRVRVVETMLRDSPSAAHVLSRIGHNPEAVDLVLQAALADSANRAHVITLMKGLQMGMNAAAK
jgi:hypothetical protein